MLHEKDVDLGIGGEYDVRDLSVMGKTPTGSKNKNKPFYFDARLGEVINNGIRYFGKQRCVNYVYKASFICPECDNLWEANINSVVNGLVKNCGCKKVVA